MTQRTKDIQAVLLYFQLVRDRKTNDDMIRELKKRDLDRRTSELKNMGLLEKKQTIVKGKIKSTSYRITERGLEIDHRTVVAPIKRSKEKIRSSQEENYIKSENKVLNEHLPPIQPTTLRGKLQLIKNILFS